MPPEVLEGRHFLNYSEYSTEERQVSEKKTFYPPSVHLPQADTLIG